ncbi:MAG: ATP-binding protein [Pseudonocardia sp.]|nr:ATP-binding protein [Pseudonocardia sp.]
MPRQFADLPGAATLATRQFQLTAQIIDDLVAALATGVVHGPAGTGKTYAVEAALERLRDPAPAGPVSADQVSADPAPVVAGMDGPRRPVQVVTCTVAFPSRPTMRLVADELVRALTGSTAARSRNRFYLTAALVELLSGPPRLLVIDEAQRLTGDCIELLRHLHDHPETRFALLYVGGDGCWEVLSREPMLASRVFRRLPFKKLDRPAVPALMRSYHRIYDGVADALLWEVEDAYGKGTLRNWAVFTQTALSLCDSSGRDRIDTEVIDNAYAKLGGGVA